MAVYTVAFISTFDQHCNVQISSIALICLGGWFYGIRAGLAAVPFFIILNTAILWHVSGKPHDILLTYNPLGIILGIIGALVMGAIKESVDELTVLRRALTRHVNDETEELSARVQQLINNDENNRIRIGQDLHDGIGQLLTGMLLHSEALAGQLNKLNRPEAKMAEQIREHCQNDLLLVRKLARAFLPNHLNHSGFEAAVHEMIDYFEQSSATHFHLNISEHNAALPRTISLHLYRIIQEALCYLLEYTQPRRVEIALIAAGSENTLSIHAQEPATMPSPESHYISKVMKYRADSIKGSLSAEKRSDTGIRLTCSWSKEEEPE